ENAKSVIDILNKIGDTYLLTGDKQNVALSVGESIGVKYVNSELYPKQKYKKIKDIISSTRNKVTYIGDGINDAPALRIADCGIAMGAMGSDQAKETADIVIMDDDLFKVCDAIKVSKYTHRVIIENIIFSLGFKFVALLLVSLKMVGRFATILSIIADVGVCLIAILNSLRILGFKIKK
ncbi:MAG: HAD-IC family P-type ATPase, partial [Bacilli bacterium]|nr:HAD-IC family P-type ATPase [Bacilli bacterium]